MSALVEKSVRLMRSPRLSILLQNPPHPKAIEWIQAMRGPAYARHYLRSRLWLRVIRPRIRIRDGNKCTICGKRAKTIHHLSYSLEVLLGLDDTKLKCVCDDHHEASHERCLSFEDKALTKRYRQVHRRHTNQKESFNRFGGKMIVTTAEKKLWFECQFSIVFKEGHNRFVKGFYGHWSASALASFKYALPERFNPGSPTGYRMPSGDCLPNVVLFSQEYGALSGTVKIRKSAHPDWREALMKLTTLFPYRLEIIDSKTHNSIGMSGNAGDEWLRLLSPNAWKRAHNPGL